MPIWNLRQGDADDDRLSPGGRGLRAIVLSALFEFNVVQAALAFALLVLVPAFLVGLVPSILTTYGALLKTSVLRLWAEPLPAFAFVAALGIAAYLWGGRLYAAATRNLWQLHYTLVPALLCLSPLHCFSAPVSSPSRSPRQVHGQSSGRRSLTA